MIFLYSVISIFLLFKCIFYRLSNSIQEILGNHFNIMSISALLFSVSFQKTTLEKVVIDESNFRYQIRYLNLKYDIKI